MGIREWNSRKSQSFTFGRSSSSRRRDQKLNKQQECIRLGQKCDQNDDYDQDSRWKMLWKKIMKEKQRIFRTNYSFNNHIHVSAIAAYDPEAYSRNFDEGVECKEPEYLTRSFSARFADPSRISQR